MKGESLITLKEAAAISGYSADYVGQLIRSGKIPGKQVYTNITWMTTAEAVLSYKSGGKIGKGQESSLKMRFAGFIRQFGFELQLIKMFFQTFKSALPIVIILIISFLLLNLSIFYFLHKGSAVSPAEQNQKEQSFTF